MSNNLFCDEFPRENERKCVGHNGKLRFGYQKNEKNLQTIEEICNEIIKDCDDKWTEVIKDDRQFSYKFCQSKSVGIIYEEVDL